MIKYNKYLILGITVVLISCTKEEYVSKIIIEYMSSYIKEALPKKQTGSFNFKDKDGKPVIFYYTGSYYNTAKYPKDPNPIEYVEKYKWDFKNSNDTNFNYRFYIDSSYYNASIIIFKLDDKNAPDSNYRYFHYILPKDSVYNSKGHNFYKTYKLGNKEYTNCFEIFKLNTTKKLVYNHTEGILYFDAAFGQNFTINP